MALNTITIHGRLCADPELRKTGSNVSVCNVTVAVDRNFAKNDETDYFDCVFWRQTADLVSKYFSKGKEIIVRGSMQQEHYEDRDGNKRTAWKLVAEEVNFCGGKSDSSGGDSDTPTPKAAAKKSAPAKAAPEAADDEEDDELPF